MLIALDVETHPILVGQQLPRVVCVNYALESGEIGILRACDAQSFLEACLYSDATIVGHSIDFDMGCIAVQWPHLYERILDVYELGRIRCTMRWSQLTDYARGVNYHAYGLDDCCKRAGIEIADKDSPWRARFAELEHLPIAAWPNEALRYCLLDAQSTLRLAKTLPDVPNVAEQSRYSFWLRLSSAFGMLTDGPRVEAWAAGKQAAFDALQRDFYALGWLRWDRKKEAFTRNMQIIANAVESAYPTAPRTPTGKVSTSADTCLESGDPLLERYAEYLDLQSALTREFVFLRQPLIHTRYDLAETGRSTSSKPNIQNFSRDSGSRLCIRPRPGHVFAICDFRMLELCALGQLCNVMGAGDILAREIRDGIDPHTMLSAAILGCSYADVAEHPDKKQTRLAAKAGNFGFPGGAGVDTWIAYARASYGVRIERSNAERIRNAWRRLRSDVVRYQRIVGQWIEGQCMQCKRPIPEARCGQCGAATVIGQLEHYRSGRLRGGLSFPQACNTLFQGLGGDVTKETGWRLTRAGFAIAAFVHDEYLIELVTNRAVEGCREIAAIAADVCREWLPLAPSSIEPTLATRWVKDDPLYLNGVLQVIDCESRT